MWHDPHEIPSPGFVVLDCGGDYSIAHVFRDGPALCMEVKIGRDMTIGETVRWCEVPPDAIVVDGDEIRFRVH